jgi:Icc-related predicted phosphoesterase
MKILLLSDTHGLHRELGNLPPADIIVHAGDISKDGEVLDFIEWFGGLDCRHKIFIAGNHDDVLYGATIEDLPDGYHYLNHSGVTIDGVRFWGVPSFVQEDLDGSLPNLVAQIPADTDVLISHVPPLGILDTTDGNSYGCPHLLDAVRRIRPYSHLFGHVHATHGKAQIGGTTFVNGALVDENYQLANAPHLLCLS